MGYRTGALWDLWDGFIAPGHSTSPTTAFHSLVSGGYGAGDISGVIFKIAISQYMLQIKFMRTCGIALRTTLNATEHP